MAIMWIASPASRSSPAAWASSHASSNSGSALAADPPLLNARPRSSRYLTRGPLHLWRQHLLDAIERRVGRVKLPL